MSRHRTLESGDLVYAGMPRADHDTSPNGQLALASGDEVASSIEKLGELKFRLA